MRQNISRIVKRGMAGLVPATAIAIAIASATLLSPSASADPIRMAQANQPAATAEPAAPAAKPKPAKPQPAAKAAKQQPPKRTVQPDDNVADELNRREAERVRNGTAGDGAAPSIAEAPAVTPVKADGTGIEQAGLPPVVRGVDQGVVPTQAQAPAMPVRELVVPAGGPPAAAPLPQVAQAQVPVPPAEAPPRVVVNPDRVVPPRDLTPVPPGAPPSGVVTVPPRMAQAAPPSPGQAAPVPRTGTPSTVPPTVEAPSRDFGRNQVVTPEQPTLSIETNKAQFLRLKSPAATVFIANPDIADVQVRSPTLIYVYGKRPGTTVLYAVDDRERVLVNTVVSVTHEFSRIMSILDRLHPGHGIIITSNNDNIILSGTAASPVIVEDARRLAAQHVQNASRVINNVRVGGPNQINLRVRVVEVNRGALKNLGISWAAVGNFGNFAIGAITGVLTGLPGSNITVGGTTNNNIAAGAYRGGNVAVDSLIQALAEENLLTVLAEPNLTAMSGETASFLAGGEVPIPVAQGGASSAITVEYKQFGVSLSFTPTLVDNRINLRVRPEVSQIDNTIAVNLPGGFTAPGFQTRRADTTIELGSGQSFAIAGLLMRTSNQQMSKVPGLGEVPVLGALFKSDRFQRNETELVIIVTPYVVQPSSTRVATPIDGYAPPSDAARYLYGYTNTQQHARGAAGPYGRSGQRLVGPVGFMVD